jgi:hypothetical protein
MLGGPKPLRVVASFIFEACASSARHQRNRSECQPSPFLRFEKIKVYVMTTESSTSRLQRDLRRVGLSKPVRELQRSS